METPQDVRDLFPDELANELLHLLQAARKDPKLNSVLQALVLMSIADAAMNDLMVYFEPGENIVGTVRNLWQRAYQEGFEDGLKGGADGNR